MNEDYLLSLLLQVIWNHIIFNTVDKRCVGLCLAVCGSMCVIVLSSHCCLLKSLSVLQVSTLSRWCIAVNWMKRLKRLMVFISMEDLISLDMKTMMWIAPRQQAFITKTKWDSDKALSASAKNYFTQQCIDWVKKYINYGKHSLLRTGDSHGCLLFFLSTQFPLCHSSIDNPP